MLLGRLCVSGVLVASLELPVFEPAHLGLLAPLFHEARALGARAVVLDFGPDTRIAPELALALHALAVSLAQEPERETARGSGVYRLALDEEQATLALSGLSAASRAALEAEPLLAEIVLADAWTDAVMLLTSRFDTVVGTGRSAAA